MSDRWYVYIFVRKDLSEEQQVVQSSHVAWNTALQLQKIENLVPDETGPDLSKVFFRIIHVDNLELLEDTCWSLVSEGIDFHVYREDDIDEITAIATYPVLYGKPVCDWLYKTYNNDLLRFNHESVSS